MSGCFLYLFPAFGVGSMTHDGFKIAQVFEDADITLDCYGPLYILVVIMHTLFTFFQTYFIFKSHAVSKNYGDNVVARIQT